MHRRTFLTRHGLQKWCPQGVDTGCTGSCLQMPQAKFVSARSASLTLRGRRHICHEHVFHMELQHFC